MLKLTVRYTRIFFVTVCLFTVVYVLRIIPNFAEMFFDVADTPKVCSMALDWDLHNLATLHQFKVQHSEPSLRMLTI